MPTMKNDVYNVIKVRIIKNRPRMDRYERLFMTKDSFNDQCSDSTQTMTIDIPCGLAERVKKYADENGTDFSGVLIEALDTFLRGG